MTPFHMFLAILVAAAWGANYVAAKLILEIFDPFLLLAVRFALVSLMLLPFFPKPVGRLKDLLVLSVVLGTIHFSLVFGAMGLGLNVSATVISSQLGVPFSCLMGSIFFKDKIGAWRSTGMLISFIGVIIIAGSPSITEQYIPFMVACAGALAWAFGNIYIKKFKDVNMLGVLHWFSLLSMPQLLVLSFLLEDGQREAIEQADWVIWLAFLYSAAISSIVGYGLWYYLLSRFPVSQVVPYSLLVPVFGLSFAQTFFHEPLTWQFILGGAFTITGVAVIVLRKPEHQRIEKQA